MFTRRWMVLRQIFQVPTSCGRDSSLVLAPSVQICKTTWDFKPWGVAVWYNGLNHSPTTQTRSTFGFSFSCSTLANAPLPPNSSFFHRERQLTLFFGISHYSRSIMGGFSFQKHRYGTSPVCSRVAETTALRWPTEFVDSNSAPREKP